MDFNYLGRLLLAASILVLALAGYFYYEAGYGSRWDEAAAIGEQIRGDERPMISYRVKQLELESNGKIALIIGGIGAVLGLALMAASRPTESGGDRGAGGGSD